MPTVGPADGSLVVKTYREGVAAKVGHDLVIDVTEWRASLDGENVELTADSRSLHVREGVRGVKPLTDKDRDDIRKNIDEKILRGQPISFSGTARDEGGGLAVDGQLTMGGSTRPVRARLERADDRVSATIPVTQSEWGIKPYRGLMGALKVRDDVEIVLDVALPAA
jgi:polyisoprenoid-binding protein YceI